MSFEQDIKPLFREFDREEMEWALDLWSYEDVRENAERILERLTDGEMPCDAPWPEEKIALFRSWVESGTPR
jgi:hypothetical protein